MPIMECRLEGKPGFKWGESGKCYTYEPGDEVQMADARRSAVGQGRAIEANKEVPWLYSPGGDGVASPVLKAALDKILHFDKFQFRNAVFTDKVDDIYAPQIQDAWFWADGRGEVAVHPVLIGPDVGRRGLLEKKGRQVRMTLKGDVSGRNALNGYADEKRAMLEVEEDFAIEVYAVKDGESFKILLIDLLVLGDKVTELDFKDRRKHLQDFFDQKLAGSGGRFDVLEVRWISNHSDLQEAVKWALDKPGIKQALLKSGVGPYPMKAPTADWYAVEKDRELLKSEVKKTLDDPTLVAFAAFGFDVKEAPESPSEAPPKKEHIDKESSCEVKIMKAMPEKQFVLGVVLEPLGVDAQMDIMVPEEIEKTAHDFLKSSRVIGFRHKVEEDADVVESYIAPVDFMIGDELVKRGSWLVGIIIKNPETWAMVKRGEINGFSVGGFGNRTELA